jgi:hypothetical protein
MAACLSSECMPNLDRTTLGSSAKSCTPEIRWVALIVSVWTALPPAFLSTILAFSIPAAAQGPEN